MNVPIIAAYRWDRALALLLMGAADYETMSQMIGLAARRGERWALWTSAFLSWAVEPNHCEKSLSGDGQATGGRAAIMSGILLAITMVFAAWVGWAVCHVFLRLLP